MGKLNCICGNRLSNVQSPNEVEGILIKDYDLDWEGEKDLIQVLELGREVWECNECGRLAISYPDMNDRKMKWYKPENGEPGHLMKK